MSHKWPQTQKDVNEFSVLNIDDDYGMEATAVLHPFGRGRFKELAECAVIPNVLLDELIKTHAERDSQSTTWKLGGAARSKFKEVAQPRAIGANTGRGRALKLRAERYAQPLRRPGQHTNKNTTVTCRPVSRSDYNLHWPPLKPAGYSGADSSDISDGFSSEVSSGPVEPRRSMVQESKKLPVAKKTSKAGRKKYSQTSVNEGGNPVISRDGARVAHIRTNNSDDLQQQPFSKESNKHTVSKYASRTSNTVPRCDQRIRACKNTTTTGNQPKYPVRNSLPDSDTFNLTAGDNTHVIKHGDNPIISVATCDLSNENFETLGPPLKGSLNKQGEGEEWTLDENSVVFFNLPFYAQRKEVIEMVKQFGTITHCRLKKDDDGTFMAYLRLGKRSSCDWVISCFNGAPYNDSEMIIHCQYALEE